MSKNKRRDVKIYSIDDGLKALEQVETTLEPLELLGYKDEEKEKPERYMGSHQICPRCGSKDTIAYKSMPIDKGTRIQYRRCLRGVCRHEFKTSFGVV